MNRKDSAKNPAAVALGRLGGQAGAGIPKSFSAAELARRRAQMKALNRKRKAKQ